MLNSTSRNITVIAIAAACSPMIAHAQVSVTRVAYQGQVVSYNSTDITLGVLNAPFTNSHGDVGFTGGASPGGNFVWFDTGITWLNSDNQVNALTGAEGTMGISDVGGFIYSPSFDGQDSVYTDNGKLLADDDAHPAIPGFFSTFNSRPTMVPGGTAHWIGGYSNTVDGGTIGRAFLKCTDTSDPNTITKILQTGDLIDGFAISTAGLGFAYDVSDSGSNYIIAALLDTGSGTTDDRVLVNGLAVAAAAGPTGSGDNWTGAFSDMSINDSGNYTFSGDTDSATTADESFAYNGDIILRESNFVGGRTLGGAVNAASMNNVNHFVIQWSTTNPTGEGLFYGRACNAAAAVRVLEVGDTVDYDGDLIADASITDMNASGVISPGLSLSDHRYVYVEVDLEDVGSTTSYEAVIRVPLPLLSDCPADVNGDCTVSVADLLAIIAAWGPCADCFTDVNGDGQVNVADLLTVIGDWGPCAPVLAR